MCAKSPSVNSEGEWCNATLQLEPSWDHELISYKIVISWKYLFVISNLPKDLLVNFLMNVTRNTGAALAGGAFCWAKTTKSDVLTVLLPASNPKKHLKLIVEQSSKNAVQMQRCATHCMSLFRTVLHCSRRKEWEDKLTGSFGKDPRVLLISLAVLSKLL